LTRSPSSVSSSKSGAGSPSRTTGGSSSRRAVGVVRVSRVGARAGEQFVSPSEQRDRIAAACERDGLELVETFDELDVSGGALLAKRPGLSRAVELVEAGAADVVVVAYFDRLVRKLAVQEEVVERVERAGGGILALDVGEVRADTAARWLSSGMLGLVAEYHRRVTAERTADAKRRAIARGVPTFPNIPPGLRSCDDGTLEPHPEDAPVVAEAFRRRAEGATVMEVRDYLRAHGIERSFHGTQALLSSRVVLGELAFGALINTDSHEPIVDAETWLRVQRMRLPRGRRAKSDRLLARLSVLRCGTCGSRMVVGTTKQGSKPTTYPFYRCSPIGDCPRRVTISAEVAEAKVVNDVKEMLAGVRETATSGDTAIDATRDYERAKKELDDAIEAFTGLEDIPAANARLLELREAHDAALGRLADAHEAAADTIAVGAGDWDELTREAQRNVIRALVAEARVKPGRGPDRILVIPRT
jgi:site-specific DNA recombinase